MRREYSTPALNLVNISPDDIIVTSPVTSVTGNGGINYGGPGQGTRSPAHRTIWG